MKPQRTQGSQRKDAGAAGSAFTLLQRASDLGEMISAGVRTVKRTKVRAPVPASALFAVK